MERKPSQRETLSYGAGSIEELGTGHDDSRSTALNAHTHTLESTASLKETNLDKFLDWIVWYTDVYRSGSKLGFVVFRSSPSACIAETIGS